MECSGIDVRKKVDGLQTCLGVCCDRCGTPIFSAMAPGVCPAKIYIHMRYKLCCEDCCDQILSETHARGFRDGWKEEEARHE